MLKLTADEVALIERTRSQDAAKASQAKREKYQSIMRKADFLTEAEQTFLSEVARKGLDGVDPFA